MSKRVEFFGFTFWLHLLLIIIAYASPFLFNWRLVLVGALALFSQFIIFNKCILTTAQFGDQKYITFYAPYLEKMGFKFKRKNIYFFMRYVMPFIVLIISLIWQILLDNEPILF
jgi:hypothetical protein